MSAKSDKKRKGKRSERFTVSSGLRRSRRARLAFNKVKSKIKRWKRYQKEIEEGTRKGTASRWDTKGLEAHAKILEKYWKLGTTKY